jgi:hypothetical protein
VLSHVAEDLRQVLGGNDQLAERAQHLAVGFLKLPRVHHDEARVQLLGRPQPPDLFGLTIVKASPRGLSFSSRLGSSDWSVAVDRPPKKGSFLSSEIGSSIYGLAAP